MYYQQIEEMSSIEEQVQKFSSNPRMQKMAREHLKIYGSFEGIAKATYGGSSTSSSPSSTPSDSAPAGSSGKYMVHCYYGCQPGNKITTVIG